MKISVKEFIESKFGKVQTAQYTTEPANSRDESFEGDLESLLTEFKNLLYAKNIGQAYNCRSGKYVIVDKDESAIIGEFVNEVI